MTTNFTQFLIALIQAWPDGPSDPELATWSQTFDRTARYNAQKKNSQEMLLNNGQSKQLAIAGFAQTDWHVLMVRCIGSGYISLSGQDAAAGAIASQVPVYGTAVLPGIVFFSTYNLTAAPTIVSSADGSIFEVYDATCVEDGA